MMLKDLRKNDVPTGRNMMKPYLKEIATFVPAILLAAVLVACGGGGSSGEPPLTYQSIVTSVPVVDYASAVSPADNLAIASQVAAIRQGAGNGLLAQNTPLDTAASKHAAFLVDNNDQVFDGVYLTSLHSGILGGHYEDSDAATYSQTYYSGASPQARATVAGYAGTVTELMVFGTASGAECLASLENSVYHSIALVSPFIDLGIGFNPGAAGGSVCAIEMGVSGSTLGQLPATAPVAYPYDGQTGVLPTFYNPGEVPDPVPGLTSAGHPVVVSLYTLSNPSLTASEIQIQEYSISASQGGAPLSARVLANTGVQSAISGPLLTADNVIPAAGFVVLVPVVPLAASTTYYLSFSATVKGVYVTKAWSFTTGIAN